MQLGRPSCWAKKDVVTRHIFWHNLKLTNFNFTTIDDVIIVKMEQLHIILQPNQNLKIFYIHYLNKFEERRTD